MTYILVLLLLILYIYAIIGVMFFGENDPFFFGYLLQAMLTLFQISTLASWSSIQGTSMFGCGGWMGSLYDVSPGRWRLRGGKEGGRGGVCCVVGEEDGGRGWRLMRHNRQSSVTGHTQREAGQSYPPWLPPCLLRASNHPWTASRSRTRR